MQFGSIKNRPSLSMSLTENEPFTTAERSERVENFLFRAMREYAKQALSRRPLPLDALAPTVQNRAGAR